MKRSIESLTNQSFDLLIIGGGILGAGMARDAILRGLRVALIEKADFASGTSSRSTKLIHGGFRYLEQYEFRLVAEACRERTVLQRVAPHLVKPRSFLLPVYAHDPRPLWQIRCGMWCYDRWAGQQAEGRHRRLSPAESLAEEPALNATDLRGSILFYDCQTDDARLCLETILDAARRGAVCVNYCEAVGAERCRDSLERVWVRDAVSGRQFAVRARAFVNAAGPWVPQVVGLATWDPGQVSLSPTKGVHLLLPPLTRRHGLFFRSSRDQRMLFLIPWGIWSLLGTTDTDYGGDVSSVHTRPADVDYLLERLHEIMPANGVTRAEILGSFAGVRPLLKASPQAPSSRSREYRLLRLGDNFLTIAGGKYTTFRVIADHAVQRVFRLLGRPAPPCRTASIPLPDLSEADIGQLVADSPPVYESAIRRACQQELAVMLSDVMRRRTTLALGACGGPEVAERVSRLMAAELGWDESTRRGQCAAYLAEWQSDRAWR